jgi:uncharacterized protein with HEPN domain
MTPDVAKRPLDALEAARRIREFVGDKGADRYAQDALIRSAVERQFEIVSEALGKAGALDMHVATTITDLPRIVGLRNRLIHGCDSVDDKIIWDIIQSKILPLIERLAVYLEKEGYPSDSR